ncbi:MAG TPA: hypothetical protein VFG07_03940 [Thermoplasmata archaeon]|nr:hypothetical protein [Thermoplasmata archaeon]
MGGTLVTVGVALMALLIVPALAAPVQASSVSLATGTSQQWAYGGAKWVNTSLILPNATVTEQSFFGWDVVFTATNTSLTTQAWEAARTMAGYFYVNFTGPSSHGNLSITGWEKDTGFANLTSAASVDQNGSAVPAVGLQNASFENAANLKESLAVTLASGPITGTASDSLTVNGAAHGTVQFTPALGLVPLNLTNGSRWNSSATYSAAGGWGASYTVSHTPFNGTPSSATFNTSGGLTATGSVQLYGADLGTVTLRNGLTVPVVAVVWNGPFDDVDGVILIPHDFDMFGNGGHAWDHEGLGVESVATDDLDVHLSADHRHMNVVAAASSFGSGATTLPVSAAVSSGAGPTALASSTSPTVVQAQPEDVAQAQQNAACLTGGCAGSGPARSLFGLVVGLAVLGAAIACLVGLVLYLRQRRGGRGPTTPTPPPGATGVSPPGEVPRTP